MKAVAKAKLDAVIRLMSDGIPRTCPEVARSLDFTGPLAANAMALLHEDEEVHVFEWRVHQGKGGRIAVYKFGYGKDAISPLPPTKHELRKMQSRREEAERKRLERERLTDFEPFRHWQDAALFGEHRRAA